MRLPPSREVIQHRRDAWAREAEHGIHGFSREQCLRVVEELDRELAKHDAEAKLPEWHAN
jgi:hypothetical protein